MLPPAISGCCALTWRVWVPKSRTSLANPSIDPLADARGTALAASVLTMHSPAPANEKYALRTGRVLERAPAVLEFSRITSAPDADDDVEEIGSDDLIEEVEIVATPAPPVIANIVRTTHFDSPPPQLPHARISESARARGPSLAAMLATVVLLGGLGALAGLGMRSLARPPEVGAALTTPGALVAPGDREQRWGVAPRVAVVGDPTPPPLAAPPSPIANAASNVAAAKPLGTPAPARAVGASPVRQRAVAGASPSVKDARAAQRATATKAAGAPAARGANAKKRPTR